MMPNRHRILVSNGESVAAVHHPADSDDWLVFCHGFLSDKSGSYEERARRAVSEGYNAVRFDFRGSGESDGAFVDSTLSTRITDLRAVVDYFEPSSYTLFGSSFGGKTAFHAAIDDDRIEALLTRAPVTYNRSFSQYRELVAEAGELRFDEGRAIDERFFEDFDGYEFDAVADSLTVPVAIFHGTDDGSVPLSDSLDAVAALSTDVMLQTFHGEGHRFSAVAESRFREAAFEWLQRVR